MPAMDILNNGLRSVTGAVVKAYIKFEDERPKSAPNVNTPKSRSAGLPGGSSGESALSKLAAKAASASSSVSNALDRMMANVKKGSNADSFSSGKTYEVKFNPKEVSFQAYGGGKVQRMNFSPKGKIQMDFVTMEPRILMNVPLVFDDYERTDAFMLEKMTDPSALARTVVSGAANALTGNTYSVRPQVEGFLAALRNENTRKMTFYWGKMAYRGVLETVSAEYTMFNMSGNPIRANVNLGILLVDESAKDNAMGYWETSYKKMFDVDGSKLGSISQDAGNLLNLKL